MTVIDRFEGEYAVIETENGMIKPIEGKIEFRNGSREGDVLRYEKGSFVTDKEATAERRRAIGRKLRRLTHKDKRGKQ